MAIPNTIAGFITAAWSATIQPIELPTKKAGALTISWQKLIICSPQVSKV